MKCKICGKGIMPNGNNWVMNANNETVHKKCPVKGGVVSDNEKIAYTRLRERLAYHATNNPRGFIAETPMNFSRAMQVVKQMHDREYSYDDILYALEEVVKQQEGFWGIKAVDNRIDMIIAQKKTNDKLKAKLIEKQKEVEKVEKVEKPKNVDLTHLMNDDYDW